MFDFLKRKPKPKDRVEVPHWSSNETLRSCLSSLRGECTVAEATYHEAVSAAVFLAKSEAWASVSEIPDEWKTGKVFILWEDPSFPALRCNAGTALEQLEDIQKVAAEGYIVSDNMDRFLRFGKDGKLQIYSV